MSKQTITLEYQLDTTLRQAMIVAKEIESETGIVPKYVTTETVQLKYEPDDVSLLIQNRITEDEYITRNMDV